MNLPPADRPSRGVAAEAPAIAVLIAALAWMVARLFLALDFTDEMQYYGEIASLVRTGKLFQDDLFLQQFGYIWTYPFFKLHALAYPDLDYFVLFGRLLTLAAYVVTGTIFWHCTGARAEFTRRHRILGLAAFFAWIPFQLFAISYNSLAYLLIVTLVALHFARERIGRRRLVLFTAILLVVLAASYPPAALFLAAVAFFETWRRAGPRQALALFALTLGGALLVGVCLALSHGAGMAADFKAALEFSRGFSGGQVFRDPQQILIWWVLAAAVAPFLWRLYTRRPTLATATDGSAPRPRIAFVTAAAVLALAALSVGWRAGYFVPVLFVALAAGLAVAVRPDDDASATALAALGLLLGTLFAISGGDGFLNFSTGVAPVIPFLVLHLAHRFETRLGAALPDAVRAGAVPLVAGCLLLNGAIHPYREQRGWSGFEPIRGVPAFKGIWTSPTKLESIAVLREVCEHGALRGKRLLVAGPHPWLYFTTGAVPATCMLFMHYTADADKEHVYELIAERMFRDGPPDAIFLTNQVPSPIGRRIQSWAESGHDVRTITLPGGFIRRYRQQTQYDFAGQIYFLQRPSAAPALKTTSVDSAPRSAAP